MQHPPARQQQRPLTGCLTMGYSLDTVSDCSNPDWSGYCVPSACSQLGTLFKTGAAVSTSGK